MPAEIARIGANLDRLASLLDGTQIRSDVAVLYDFPTRWLQEAPAAFDCRPRDLYMNQGKMLYRVLRAAGVNVDAVGRHQDFAPYKVLVVPMLVPVEDNLAARLAAYVAGGGTLVWYPLSGLTKPAARRRLWRSLARGSTSGARSAAVATCS